MIMQQRRPIAYPGAGSARACKCACTAYLEDFERVEAFRTELDEIDA